MESSALQRIIESSESYLKSGESENAGWRPVNNSSRINSFSRVGFATIYEGCYDLYRKNPIAQNSIETTLDYIIGSGVYYSSDDKDTQDVLSNFWRVSGWESYLRPRLRSLFISGELIFRVDVSDGVVKTYWQDPLTVDESKIKVKKEDIENISFLGFADDTEEYKVIKRYSKNHIHGDVFLLQLNKISGEVRGVSDLYTMRDWGKRYDTFMANLVRYVELMTKYTYDITLKGADASNREKILQKANDIKSQMTYDKAFRIHSDAEEWKSETPSLGNADFDTIDTIIKSYAVMATRQPLNFFGRSDSDSNRATALSQNAPFYRKITARQKMLKSFFTLMGEYAIQEAKLSGILPQTDCDFKFVMPDPDAEKSAESLKILSSITDPLVVLSETGLLSEEKIDAILKYGLESIGVDFEDVTEDDTISSDISKKVDVDIYERIRSKL